MFFVGRGWALCVGIVGVARLDPLRSSFLEEFLGIKTFGIGELFFLGVFWFICVCSVGGNLQEEMFFCMGCFLFAHVG